MGLIFRWQGTPRLVPIKYQIMNGQPDKLYFEVTSRLSTFFDCLNILILLTDQYPNYSNTGHAYSVLNSDKTHPCVYTSRMVSLDFLIITLI
jgi:hypothetical protein